MQAGHDNTDGPHPIPGDFDHFARYDTLASYQHLGNLVQLNYDSTATDFLLLEQASYVTGQVLAMEAGGHLVVRADKPSKDLGQAQVMTVTMY
ncbi:hypothetical protein [Janthinobacterium sp. RT4P48]|uniref:hypothetical protein n=1 Tax=Janthinobacterium sp. RT4P48 TaxID=3424188 RepID=UPI003F20D40D